MSMGTWTEIDVGMGMGTRRQKRSCLKQGSRLFHGIRYAHPRCDGGRLVVGEGITGGVKG